MNDIETLEQALAQVNALPAKPTASERHKPRQQARDYLIDLYLDRFNNYLTTELFAEHNGLTDSEALDLLVLARKVYNHKHPEA